MDNLMSLLRPQAGILEGTAKPIKAKLADVPDDEVVRLMVGRSSLSIIARKLQGEAASRGMTGTVHDEITEARSSTIRTLSPYACE